VADNLPDVYLRFVGSDPNIRGESMDAAYPASEGWLEIKGFDFGFGWDASTSSVNHDDITKKIATGKPLTPPEAQQLGQALKPKEPDKAAKPPKADQTLQAHPFSFSRTAGPASIDLIKKLQQGGEPIPKVEVIVCRSAAEATFTAAKDAKIPFLQLTLEKVNLVNCKVTISKEEAPAESVEFKFFKAQIKTIWTDNATGEKTTGGDLTAWFDFEKTAGHVSWAEGEAGDF
jgi:type VI protein secretion system component Hcp